MRKRVHSDILMNEPLRKKSVTVAPVSCECLKQGEILTDLNGKKWKLGKAIGVGGFGEIYLASDNLNDDFKSNSQYVAKVEVHTSGPLFVEINCYLRIAKQEMSKYYIIYIVISILCHHNNIAFPSDISSYLVLTKFVQNRCMEQFK